MSETICTECGARNTESTGFCASCGAYLAWDPAPTSTATGGIPNPAVAGPAVAARPPVAPPMTSPPAAPWPPATQPAPRAAPPTQPMTTSAPAPTTPVPTTANATPRWTFGAGAAASAPGHSTGATDPSRSWADPAATQVLPATGGRQPPPPTTALQPPPPTTPLQPPPLPATTPLPAVTAAAGQTRCPQCGNPNDSSARFCRRCGRQLITPTERPAARAATPRAAPVPWWRRWLGRSSDGNRAARSAWRRSLPLGYRIRRWLVGILVVAVIGGGLTLIGRNPIGWLVDRWNDLRDVQQPVTTVTAVGVPDELPGFPAAAAIDGAIDTGWATNWPADQQPIAGCAPPAADAAPGTTGSLVVSLGASRKVKALRIFAGPGTPDRVNQPRPKTLQIGYTGGCADVDLADVAEVQTKELDFTTDAVWITVTSVWPSNAVQPVPQVQISEFEFLARPL